MDKQDKKLKKEGLPEEEIERLADKARGLPDTPENVRIKAFFCSPVRRRLFLWPSGKLRKRSIWVNLGWALAATPIIGVTITVVIALLGALDDAITVLQSAGYWWVIFLVAYVLSLTYLLCQSTIRRNRERTNLANGLILYLREELAKQGRPQPSDGEIESYRKMFLERVEVWACSDPELWNRRFPNEEYSIYLFGIVDSFMAFVKDLENKKNGRIDPEYITLFSNKDISAVPDYVWDKTMKQMTEKELAELHRHLFPLSRSNRHRMT